MRRPPLLLLAALTAFALFACRDGVAPFALPRTEPEDSALARLTFGAGDERDPQWAPAGDVVYYHTDAWFDAPALRGVLLRIDPAGGTAALLAPEAQAGTAFRLLLPVPSPDGERIAYLQLVRELDDRPCSTGGACPWPSPLLDSAVLRVRALGSAGSVLDDVGIGIGYPGASRASEAPFVERVYPYQLDYRSDNQVANLRPGWSPDGTRLVFSDGTQLLLWRIGDAAATPVPNTADGVAPRWSPDGSQIAFGVIVRGEERTGSCNCAASPAAPPLLAERTGWDVAQRVIALVRPDGSGLRLLTEGSEPVWTAAGDALYFRRGEDGIFRIELAAGEVRRLVGTERARSPALSPDGRTLVFARRNEVTHDIDLWRLHVAP